MQAFVLIRDRELEMAEYERLLKIVSPEKRSAVQRYRFYKDAQNSLLGDIAVRRLLSLRLGLLINEIKFTAGAFGKPFLAGNPSAHFNLSHSGQYIACAADSRPAGIDIECLSPVRWDIAKEYFSADETGYVFQDSDNIRRMKRFYRIWTMKESYIKRDGRGMSIPLTSFSVLDPAVSNTFFHCIFDNGTAIGHVCTAEKRPPSCVTKELSDFLKEIDEG